MICCCVVLFFDWLFFQEKEKSGGCYIFQWNRCLSWIDYVKKRRGNTERDNCLLLLSFYFSLLLQMFQKKVKLV